VGALRRRLTERRSCARRGEPTKNRHVRDPKPTHDAVPAPQYPDVRT
jgi:hypothetical protein